jgi:hypothetical protein
MREESCGQILPLNLPALSLHESGTAIGCPTCSQEIRISTSLKSWQELLVEDFLAVARLFGTNFQK